MPTHTGYWTEGKIVNGVNVGGGKFVQGTPPTPKGNVVPIISSDSGKTTIDTAVKDHQTDIQSVTPTPQSETPAPEKPTSQKKDTTLEAMGAITREEAQTTGANVADYTYDTNSGYLVPKNTTGKTSEVDAKFAAEEQQINTFYASLTAGMDASTRNLVDSYKAIFQERINEQKDLNKRELATFDTMNTRFGTTRYAPGVATGVLVADERAGLDRIKKIIAEEVALISQANNSLQDKKYTAFMSQRGELKDLKNEKQTILENMQKTALEQQKLMREKVETFRKQEREGALMGSVAELYGKGVTDPLEILANLQANGIDVNLEETNKITTIYKRQDELAGLSPDLKTYEWLKSNRPKELKAMGVSNYQDYIRTIASAKRKGETEGDDNIPVTPEDMRNFQGVNLTPPEIKQLVKDINQFGIDKVLESQTDPAIKKSIQKAYGVQEKVSREQLTSSVTQKSAQEGLKDTYTDDELSELARDNGFALYFTGKAGEVEKFLDSDKARELYVNLLYKQYEDAGMTSEKK